MMAKQNGTCPKEICKLHSLAPKNGSKMSLQPKVIQSKGRSHFCLIIGQNEDQFSPACEQGSSRLWELLASPYYLEGVVKELSQPQRRAKAGGPQQMESQSWWQYYLQGQTTLETCPTSGLFNYRPKIPLYYLSQCELGFFLLANKIILRQQCQ